MALLTLILASYLTPFLNAWHKTKLLLPLEDMEKKVDKLLKEVGGNSGRGGQRGVNLQDDLAECASRMYKKAYEIFKENIENFYKLVNW